MEILVTTRSCDEDSVSSLIRQGFTVSINRSGKTLNATQLKDLASNIGDVEAVIAGLELWDAAAMDFFPNLKVISRVGVGIDNVDTKAARDRSINVKTTENSVAPFVAEHTLALAFALLRRIPLLHSSVASKHWVSTQGESLMGKKIGVIGLGRIGRSVSALFSSIGCPVFSFDPHFGYSGMRAEHFPHVTFLNLEELLQTVDLLTLHTPLTDETRGMIGHHELLQLKRGSYLLNTARGGLVDEMALFRLLDDGHLAGAALDVFENEPYAGPLGSLENVVLTPHSSTNTKQARSKMFKEAIDNAQMEEK